MIRESATSRAFREHVDTLLSRALEGDDDANRSLACIALLAAGWRYGDPDPVDPDGPDGGETVDLGGWDIEVDTTNIIPFRRAA